MSDEDRKPTSAMLRNDIDEGKTGDKVGFPDPAASPLGTDAEAGGVPPSAEELRIAREAERQRPDTSKPSQARPNSAATKDEDDE